MREFNIYFVGICHIIVPFAVIILWHKRTNARYMPFIAGVLMIIALSFIRGAIRSTFDRSDLFLNLMKQILLTSVLEEVCRYIAFSHVLKNYDRREDSVMYGVGHGFMEEIGTAVMVFGLISEPERETIYTDAGGFLIGGFMAITAPLFHILLSAAIFYAVQSYKVKTVLPAAIAYHFFMDFLRICAPVPLDLILEYCLLAVLTIVVIRLYRKLPETDI